MIVTLYTQCKSISTFGTKIRSVGFSWIGIACAYTCDIQSVRSSPFRHVSQGNEIQGCVSVDSR